MAKRSQKILSRFPLPSDLTSSRRHSKRKPRIGRFGKKLSVFPNPCRDDRGALPVNLARRRVVGQFELRVRAESVPTEVASGRTEVRAIAVIPLRTRSTLHRPKHAFIKAPANRREGRNSILRRPPGKGGLGPSSANRFVVRPKSRSCEGLRGPRRHAASSPSPQSSSAAHPY